MSTRKPIADDVMAQGRRLYEDTDLPVRDIALTMGICHTTLYRNVENWGWTKRPPPGFGMRPQRGRRGPQDRIDAMRHGLVERIQRAVASQLTSLEGRFGEEGAAGGTDRERSARALASLARTIRELHAIELAADKSARKKDDEDDDDAVPRDIDELRRALAERLERLLAARDDRPDAGGEQQG